MNQIDVAVLGLGRMGQTHADAAKESPYVNRIYGYEPDPERCRARAAEIGVIPASLEEILGNMQIRFVSIAASKRRMCLLRKRLCGRERRCSARNRWEARWKRQSA